ncbi:MAG: glucokinase [Rhodocyclaceae bacterium]|nr:glucokinase [Rhodocyclaceae bacterium]MBX3670285.1 glucokinase [Rhodocyclaceae bacterium]
MPTQLAEQPDLVADIGGTNARFALVHAGHAPHAERTLPCAEYPDVLSAARAYLTEFGAAPRRACLAVATPIIGDHVAFTNSPWQFSIEATRDALQLERLLLINDFTAQAWALPLLTAADLYKVGRGRQVPGAPMGVVGPGTGLGVSGLVANGKHWVALQGEGGHASFSPANEFEANVLRAVWRQFPHVSCERLISGVGLPYLYSAVAALEGRLGEAPTAAAITDAALAGTDPLCRTVLDTFCAMLGTVAGNLALMLGARGGIYIAGGIVPRLGDFFAQSPFRERFEAKGRYQTYLSEIPTYVILSKSSALLGAAWALHNAGPQH